MPTAPQVSGAFGVRRSEIEEEAWVQPKPGDICGVGYRTILALARMLEQKGEPWAPLLETYRNPTRSQTVSSASTPVAVFEIGMW